MNSQPPNESRDTLGETTGPDSDGGSQSQNGNRRWKSVVMITGIVIVAGAAAVLLYLTHGSDTKNQSATPRRGLACPHLREAADASKGGDQATFSNEIAQAARVAEDTLQKSGETFGEPERIALELALGTHSRISELLAQAEIVCSRLGQWNDASR